MAATLTGLKRSDGGIRFTWSDGLAAQVSVWSLRCRCPCAHCVSETTGQRLVDPAAVPRDLALQDMKPVGRYAYRCLFGDGHDTGLYTVELLRALCEEAGAP